MKTNIIHLEASFHKGQLKLACHDSFETLFREEESSGSWEDISEYCSQMTARLNTSIRVGDDCSHNIDDIKSTGRMLFDKMLTNDCREKLSDTKAEYLIIKMDDSLVHLHWELIFDGEKFLCQRFKMGRIVRTNEPIQKNRKRHLEQKMHIGIIANPSGDLESAENEGIQIFNNARLMNRLNVVSEPEFKSQTTHDELTSFLKNYDIIHYAGHATFHSKDTDQCGWTLNDKTFSAKDISKLGGSSSMPSFIFSNACQSARTSVRQSESDDMKKKVLGLAHAFLFAGVNHYLGTTWDISDQTSSTFAQEFYTNLFKGKSIGASVTNARNAFIESNDANNVIWTSYILYGDPTATYFTENEKVKQRIKFQSPVYKKRRLRGLFNYTWDTDRLIKKMSFCLLLIAIIFSGLFGYFYISNEKENRKERIHARLIEQAKEHQQRVDDLSKAILKKWPDAFSYAKSSPDGWTSSQLPVAIVFDCGQLPQGRENMILSAIQQEMLNHLTFINLIERKSLDVLLNEWLKGNEKPEMTLPKLIIILEVYKDNSKIYVLMRLVENWNQIIKNIITETHSNEILFQKKSLSLKLLQIMKKHYPVRGIVSKNKPDSYLLNIGNNEGVRLRQTFKSIVDNYSFTVISVNMNTSQLKNNSDKVIPNEKLKLELFYQ